MDKIYRNKNWLQEHYGERKKSIRTVAKEVGCGFGTIYNWLHKWDIPIRSYTGKDITGQRFGRLIALYPTAERRSESVVWATRCDCGQIAKVAASHLSRGYTRSCGCLRRDTQIKDLFGQRFGRLVAIYPIKERYRGHAAWLCKCDCGNETVVPSRSLHSGDTKSCGCWAAEITSRNNAKRRGPQNPNWNPGLTNGERELGRNIPEYADWRKAVYERDKYTCQYCGDKTSGNLNAHHIESYVDNPELRTTVENGITLCKKHHEDFHHQFGYGNNTREQFEQFLQGREGILL